MTEQKNTVHLTWDSKSIYVRRNKGDTPVELREFPETQTDRAFDLFAELVNDKCGGGVNASARSESSEPGEVSRALLEAVGLLVRIMNDVKLPADLDADIENFVERMGGGDGEDGE